MEPAGRQAAKNGLRRSSTPGWSSMHVLATAAPSLPGPQAPLDENPGFEGVKPPGAISEDSRGEALSFAASK